MGVLSSSPSLVDVPELGQGPESDSTECGPRLAQPDACVGLNTSPEPVSDLSDSGGEEDIMRKVRSSKEQGGRATFAVRT